MQRQSDRLKPRLPRWALWVVGGLLLVGLTIVMARVWPPGADYAYHRQPLAEGFLAGETRLYDGRITRFRLAPWSLLALLPLSFLPMNVGQAVLNVISLVGMVVSMHALRGDRPIPFYALVMAVANLDTFDLLIRGGKFDAIVLLGVALCWQAIRAHRPLALSFGLWLIAIKPINVVLPALLFLYAIRKWSLTDLALAFSLPVLSVVASGFFIGFDWPWRYLTFNQGTPPNDYLSLSLWRSADRFGFPHWPIALLGAVALAGLIGLALRVGLGEWSLAVALATNLTFTPYANDSHLVLLVPAFLYVVRYDWKLGLLAYLATWTPLLRLRWGYGAVSLDILYPLLLLVASWWIGLRSRSQTGGDAPLPT